MGFYDDVILPWCIELACGNRAIEPERKKVTAGLHGTVLEIGFGSGLNLDHLPSEVREVVAVEPSMRGREIARKRIERSKVPVRFIGLDAERIDAADASADDALSTFTLCTIPDPVQALVEVRRILKPGGRLHFVEHGRAPDPSVARWQERLDPLEQKLAGGCHLTRDIARIVSDAGFRIESLDTYYLPRAPRTHGYLYSGVAVAG